MKRAAIIIAIFLILGIAAIALSYLDKNERVVITNFEECIAAGNPAMESYPRQCRAGGQTFVEELEEGNIPTSADNAPPGSIHNLPVPDAVAAVRTHVATELGISEGVVIVMTAFEKEWPNTCLGLAVQDELCAQVITPGYEVTVQAQGLLRTYRTNADGSVLRREL